MGGADWLILARIATLVIVSELNSLPVQIPVKQFLFPSHKIQMLRNHIFSEPNRDTAQTQTMKKFLVTSKDDGIVNRMAINYFLSTNKIDNLQIVNCQTINQASVNERVTSV